VRHELRHWLSVVSLVSQGMGVALVPEALRGVSAKDFLESLSALDGPMQERLAAARKNSTVLRYVARLDGTGTAKVGLVELPSTHAFAHIAHRKTERVPIDALEGRITTSLLTPYPPGIPLLIPGERFNKKIVDYLRFTREFNAAFPGFDTDVHGLVEDDSVMGQRSYYVDCVRE
jgi:arginine/lysine/ornithine decarboxylase